MAGGIKGITVEIGGDTTKLGKALEGVNSKTRHLQKELNGVNSLLKMDPGNVTLLAQKQDILTEAIAETTGKLKLLKDSQEQVQKQFENGEIGADQYRDFQREIIATEKKLAGLTDELESVDDTIANIDNVENAIEDLGDTAKNSGDGFTVMKGALADLVADGIQSAIGAVGDLVGQLFDLTEATQEFRSMQGKLSGSAESFGYSADFASGKFQEFYKYMGDDMGATNAITNLMGIGTSVDSVSKLAEGAIGVWASYGDSIPIESLTESINETIQVGKVTGTMADTINWAKTSHDQLRAALDGNSNAQKAYNDAIEEGLPAEDAFNEALAQTTSEQERADIVAKFLNSTYGESKKTYDEMNGSILSTNEAELKLKTTQAQLGETMAPLNTAFTNFKAQALEALAPVIETIVTKLTELISWLQQHPAVLGAVVGVVSALALAFGVLTTAIIAQTVAQWAQNAAWLANPLTWIILAIVAAIGVLVGAFVALWNKSESFRNFFIGLWEAIKNAVQPILDAIALAFKVAWDAIKVAWDAAKPYFAAIWEGIKIVFSVVAQVLGTYFKFAWNTIKSVWDVVVAYFQLVWDGIQAVFSVVATFLGGMFKTAWTAIKAVWDTVTGYFEAVWETIKTIFSVVGAVLTGNWSEAWAGIRSIVDTWTSYFSGVWNSIKSVFSAVGAWFTSTFQAAINGVKSVWNGITNYFSTLWSSIKNIFADAKSKFLEIGRNIVAGIKEGISNAWDNLVSWFTGLFGDLKAIAKKILGIKSPSRVFRDEIGKQIVAGLIAGIKAEESNAKKSIQELAELYITEMDSLIKKKQDYREIAIGDEIFLWSEIIKECEKGTNAYKDIELKLLDAHSRYVDEQRQNNNMSIQGEMTYWINLAKTCEKGSVLYKRAMEKFNEVIEEYETSFIETHQKHIDERKKNNDMSLSSEVQYWQHLLKQTDRNAKNYNAIYEKMVVSGEKLLEESTKLQTQYVEDTQSVKDKLIDDIQAVTDAYDKAVSDRQKQISSSMGLFDAFTPKETTDKQSLINNLETQVDALQLWDETLDKLSSRKGLQNSNLLKELEGMGVDSLGTLEQINAMSDEELASYISLYDQKNQIAMERAVAESESLRIASEQQIKILIQNANEELDALEETYVENLQELGLSAADQSKKIGSDIVGGLMNGINSATPNFQNFLNQFFRSIVTTAEAALDIHSPSRVLANVIGKQIPAGIAKGMLDNSGVVNKAMTDLSNGIVNEASHLDGATINRRLNATFSAQLGNSRTLSDIMVTMVDCTNKIYDRLNRLQVVLDSGTLVGETIDKIDAGLADRQILTARGL